jgi:hypothetical protein
MSMPNAMQNLVLAAYNNDQGDAGGDGIGDGSVVLVGSNTELIEWSWASGALSVTGNQLVGSTFGEATASAGSPTTIDAVRYKFNDGTTAWESSDISGVDVDDDAGDPVTAITAGQKYNLNSLTITPPND